MKELSPPLSLWAWKILIHPTRLCLVITYLRKPPLLYLPGPIRCIPSPFYSTVSIFTEPSFNIWEIVFSRISLPRLQLTKDMHSFFSPKICNLCKINYFRVPPLPNLSHSLAHNRCSCLFNRTGFLFLFLIDFIFLSSFVTVLGSQKNWTEGTESSLLSPARPCPPHIGFSIINIPHESGGTVLQWMNLHRHITTDQRSWFTLGSTWWVWKSGEWRVSPR